MMRILAFDPGVTTGYAIVDVVDGIAIVVDAGQFPDYSEVYDLVQNLARYNIDENKAVQLVYEKFQVGNIAVNTKALEVIGAIGIVASIFNVPIKGQPPQRRKPILDRFPHLKLSAPKGDHSVSHWWDASLHALTHAYIDMGIRQFRFDHK